MPTAPEDEERGTLEEDKAVVLEEETLLEDETTALEEDKTAELEEETLFDDETATLEEDWTTTDVPCANTAIHVLARVSCVNT